MKKSELRQMIREVLREELIRESRDEAPELINEDGYMSSLNSAVGEHLANKFVFETDKGKTIKTLPANKLEYNRRALNNGRDRQFWYVLAQDLYKATDTDIMSSDVYDGFKKIQSTYKSDKRMNVSHDLRITDSYALVYTVTMKPNSGYMLYDPHDKAFAAAYDDAYGNK